MLNLLKKQISLLLILFFSSLAYPYPINGSAIASSKLNIKNDSLGNTISLWHQYDPEKKETNILTSFQLIGGSWTPPTVVSGDFVSNVDPIVEISDSDSVICLWLTVHLDSGINSLMGSFLDSIGGSWSTPVLISDKSENLISGWYNISVSGKNVNCIWASYILDPDKEILVKTIRTSNGIIGGEWTPPTTLY
jgi:hypothetical protein